MIVAMVAMRMMEPTTDEIVDMVAMRNRLVPAAGSMDMAGLVTFVAIRRRAPDGVSGGHFNNVLIDLVPLLAVQMSVMEVVDVAAVFHREVTALRAVMMRMLGMREMVMDRHGIFSFRSIDA